MLKAAPGAQLVKTRYESLSEASNSIRKVTRSTPIVPSPPASKLAKHPSPPPTTGNLGYILPELGSFAGQALSRVTSQVL